MLRISQLKLPVTHTEEDLKKKIVHTLMCRTEEVQSYEIIKQSLDARKKPELFYVYTVDVKADNEKQLLKMLTRKKRVGNVQLHEAMPYIFPAGGNEKLKSRPVVVGCGPAGLFCAYFLQNMDIGRFFWNREHRWKNDRKMLRSSGRRGY